MFNFYAFLRRKFAEYSTSSGQQGTAVDDLAVKPTGLVMADFNNSLVAERVANDITQWESMTEDELDTFGNKYFMPRTVGAKASGYVRIWFDYKFDFEVSVDFRAVSYNSLTYSAVQPGYISANSFRVSTESYGLYHVDIPIIADAEGNSYNVAAGKITSLSGINFQYKTATNPDALLNGLNRETNEQYYKRLRYGINDGSMMNLRSMYARLPEFFPSIISMFVANPGSKYMSRDLVSGEDLSSPSKLATYLGKTQASNMVKHSAFYGSFPPESWSEAADYRLGLSIPSDFEYPLTIEASDLDEDDPGYHGYPLSQEATDLMYSGLFFNDYSSYMERSTENLFDIYEEDVGFSDVIIPNDNWMYGSHYRPKGEFGDFADGVAPIDVMYFNNNIISLAGGCEEPISVSKDIGKRINVKITGSFTWPEISGTTDEALDSNLQIMLAGVNNPIVNDKVVVDAFNGVGFGVRVTAPYEAIGGPNDLNYNAIVYIAHSERYGTAQVFATDEDETDHISMTDMGALAERQFRIEPEEEYQFEFVLYDDLRVTLYFRKTNENTDPLAADIENELHFNLSSQVLKIFKQELLNTQTAYYGTMLKVSLETPSTDSDDVWAVSDLNAFDVDQHRSNMLFAINVKDMEDPLTVYMRAFGSGAVEGVAYEGYEAYIWDKEAHSVASNTNSELTNGGWSAIDGISNSDGTKEITTGLLSHDIQSSDRYVVNSRFGKAIFILVTTSGTSKASIKYGGDFTDDVVSTLKVDYLKVASRASQSYHANNKADLHVVTYQNSEEPDAVSTVLEKNDSDSFFEMNLDNDCQMPVAEIISVSAGGTEEEVQAISPTEYSIILTNDELYSSSQETVQIVLSDTSINTITVQYRSYPLIEAVQEFFDGTNFGKIYGDILVKHKRQVNISFSVTYKGDLNTEQIIDEIRQYVDENNGPIFSVREMITYLYNNNLVTSVNEPITVSYVKLDEDLEEETGEFTDELEIEDIEFFRIDDLTVEKI